LRGAASKERHLFGRALEFQFVEQVAPLLAREGLGRVLAHLRELWPVDLLQSFLGSPHARVVRLSAQCLGIHGDPDACRALVCLLGHADPEVAREAEDALWSIWMRSGSDTGNERLLAAMRAAEHGDLNGAIQQLGELCSDEPEFAEAHHQRGLALLGLERLERADAAYGEALLLNPLHFAAASGRGHICVQRGDLAGALRYYRRALHLHPRLAEIREVVPQLDAALERRVVA